MVGLAVGVGAYTFVYAQGASYLTNDPDACANCHVMSDHYGSWLKSSHGSVATCNDCHTPKGTVAKYLTKASNGFWHSFAFTTGEFPDPIRIKERNRQVAERACLKCHAEVTEAIAITATPAEGGAACAGCHRTVGHWVR